MDILLAKQIMGDSYMFSRVQAVELRLSREGLVVLRIEKGNANELKTMWIKEEEDQILKKIREKKQRFSEIINKSCMYIVCIHTLFLT